MKIQILFILLLMMQSFFSFAQSDVKIVSLAPNLTEIIYALGLGKNLVGNTSLCDYPDAAINVFKVGQFRDPSLEKIIASGANVVLATDGNPISKLNKLNSLGIEVINMSLRDVQDIPKNIIYLSNKLGVGQTGQELAKKIEKAIQNLKKSSKKNKKILYLLQIDPMFTASEDTWLGGILKLAGFENIVKNSKIKYPIISKEFLLKNTPDIILVGGVEGKTDLHSQSIQKNKIMKFLNVKTLNSKIIIVPKDILVRPGPRIIDGISFVESL